MWKEKIMGQFDILSWYLPGGIEETMIHLSG
jgi:hypothetical protein